MLQYNPSISGSLSVTGSLIVTNGVIGTVSGVDVQIFSSSINQVITGIQATTGSQEGRLTSIESFTSSVSTTNIFTSSTTARLNSIETISASNIARINALETTSASVNTVNIAQNTRLVNLEEKTGSLASTGSNTFYGTQTITGSLYVSSNLIVQGSSSLQNITASAVDIGTNKIILNVNNPAVRYAGISVYDSGSTSGTGSLWWDSVDNHWVYEHPSDSAAPYNSAILISGPKNAGNLGEELELVNNFIVKAVGGDHISSSAIYDDGTTIALKSNTEISGTFKHNASTASFAGMVGIGSATPVNTLDVRGGASFGDIKVYNSVQLSTGTYNGSTDGWMWAGATGTLNFGTGSVSNTNKILSILPGGVVGIGMTNGYGRVKIIAENNTGYQGLNVFNSGTGTYSMGITHDGSVGVIASDYIGGSGASYTPIVFLTDNAERMRIMNSTGRIGIGITNPSYKLHLRSTESAYTMFIENTYAGNNAGLLIKAGVNPGNEILNCQAANGNDIFKVDVSGEITSTNGEMYFKRTAFSPYGHVYMGSDQNFYLRNTGAGNVDIYTNSNSRLKVTSAGYVQTPYNPAFSMYVSGNVTGPSVVAAAGTIFNDGTHFNTSTYQFTAPVAGRYLFSFYDNIFPNNANPAQFYFRVNGTRRGAIAYTLNKGNSWYLISFQQVLKLSVGDVVDVYNDSGDRPDYGSDAWGNFSGAYLG